MGCSASKSTKTATVVNTNGRSNHPQQVESNSSSRYEFSDEQKKLVRKNWKFLANDLTGRGTKVFLKIFLLNTEVKSLFPFRELEGEKLIKGHEFKGHASRFMQAVGAVVDNIDTLDQSLAPLLIDLGKQHIHFKGFKPDYFNAFEHAMLSVWSEELGNKFDHTAREAWNKIFKFILMKLKEGFAIAIEAHSANNK